MYDKWSLEVLYKSFEDENFKSDVVKVDEMVKEYQAFADTLGENDTRETVKKALELEESFTLVFHRLYSYCSLRQSADTSDKESVSWMGRFMQKSGDMTKASTRIEQYIAKIEDMDAIIGEDEFLLEYEDYLQKSKETLSSILILLTDLLVTHQALMIIQRRISMIMPKFG